MHIRRRPLWTVETAVPMPSASSFCGIVLGVSTAPSGGNMTQERRYISVPNWRDFQHYNPAVRQPPWIKVNTSLMSNDDYLGLSTGARGVLHGIWMEYARSRCELPGDTLTLTRRLCVKVSKRTLDSLSDAGFIQFVASKTLADGYQDASARARPRTRENLEVEEERSKALAVNKTRNPSDPLPSDNGRATELVQQVVDSLEEIPF